MLFGLEIFPLRLYLAVQFQFRITFSIFETELLIYWNQIVEQQSIDSLVLLIRLHGYQKQVKYLRIFLHEDKLHQVPPTERQETTLTLLQSFAE